MNPRSHYLRIDLIIEVSAFLLATFVAPASAGKRGYKRKQSPTPTVSPEPSPSPTASPSPSPSPTTSPRPTTSPSPTTSPVFETVPTWSAEFMTNSSGSPGYDPGL